MSAEGFCSTQARQTGKQGADRLQTGGLIFWKNPSEMSKIAQTLRTMLGDIFDFCQFGGLWVQKVVIPCVKSDK